MTEPNKVDARDEATSEAGFPAGRFALGLLGACVGGLVGFYAFKWLLSQGLYALLLPGSLVGLGCWLAGRHKSLVLGVICIVGALALGLVSEWLFRPFGIDQSFAYFITHLGDLDSPAVTLGMIAGGGLLSFWFAKG
jgi:hypothetical protein